MSGAIEAYCLRDQEAWKHIDQRAQTMLPCGEKNDDVASQKILMLCHLQRYRTMYFEDGRGAGRTLDDLSMRLWLCVDDANNLPKMHYVEVVGASI